MRTAATAVPLFRLACEEVLTTLEFLRQRLKPIEDFELDEFLAYRPGTLDRIPSSVAELDSLGKQQKTGDARPGKQRHPPAVFRAG